MGISEHREDPKNSLSGQLLHGGSSIGHTTLSVHQDSARAYSWRGAFGVHTWIAAKPTGAEHYTRFEVIGWRLYRGSSVVAVHQGVPDGHWYGNRPFKLASYRGEGVDQMIDKIRAVASRHEPFSLSTAVMKFVPPEDSVIVGFPVNPEFQALHDDLIADIAPLGKPAYPDDPYKVHMSIVNRVGEEGREIARNLLHDVDFGAVIPARSIELLARDGVAWGGTWKRLESFELGG